MGNLGEACGACLRCKTPELPGSEILILQSLLCSPRAPRLYLALQWEVVGAGRSSGVQLVCTGRLHWWQVFSRSPQNRSSMPESWTSFTDARGTFFFFFFFSMATQLGEIPFLTESSVSLKNIKSMTDLLSIGFPKDPGIPSWTSLGIHNLISGRCWDSVFTVSDTSEAMGMCWWHANFVLPPKPPKQKSQSSSSTLSSHRAEERPPKYFHPPT